jgi:small conductance mechanosensitive channel
LVPPSRRAYPALSILMTLTAGGMVLDFWRKGWIGRRRQADCGGKRMQGLLNLAPSLGTTAAVILLLFVAHRILERGGARAEGRQFRNQLVMLALSLIALLVIVVTLPVSENLRGQLLAFFGILLSAAIALASTTFLGNALAGIMLKGAIRNFRMGDFIRCGEHFGRVSERGLLHTEIQTADRDLVTLPNLYLVSHPVKTVLGSGTIVSSTVSLGYDVPRNKIETSLLRAAERAGLRDPFVRILELGDFSVSYRVAGLLEEVKKLVVTESLLNGEVLDQLHADDIEIVSPTFMNTRSLAEGRRFIPRTKAAARHEPSRESRTEDVVFDKADAAESLENMRESLKKIDEEIDAQKKQLKSAEGDPERAALETALAKLESRKQALSIVIAKREEKGDRNE